MLQSGKGLCRNLERPPFGEGPCGPDSEGRGEHPDKLTRPFTELCGGLPFPSAPWLKPVVGLG